jgi:hypothetical protein
VSRRVYLHVGIAKTGTTYLQRRLFANRALLRRHGTLYPGSARTAHFYGSLDLRGTTFKGHEYDGVAGAWDRLVAAADAFDGTTLISHETLARAKPEHIDRAVTSFATDDLRIVITARDLVRQIPATWQETLKNADETPYAEYVSSILTAWTVDRPLPRAGFWGAQDLIGLIRRWARAVGVERVAVVTVPPSGADPGELWRRFALATELPEVAYVDSEDTSNTSLGVAEAELLRRLNPLLADALDWPTYESVVKHRLAGQVLAASRSAGALTVPPEWRATVDQIASSQVDAVRESGVTVIGDLHDLLPAAGSDPDSAQARQPAELTDADLLDAALRGLAALAASTPPPPAPTPGRRVVAGLRRRARTLTRRLR